MPKLDPHNCTHVNIHPGRVDGAHTVCLDCEHLVIVMDAQYMGDTTAQQQFIDTLRRLKNRQR